jgi:hypothetical protein
LKTKRAGGYDHFPLSDLLVLPLITLICRALLRRTTGFSMTATFLWDVGSSRHLGEGSTARVSRFCSTSSPLATLLDTDVTCFTVAGSSLALPLSFTIPTSARSRQSTLPYLPPTRPPHPLPPRLHLARQLSHQPSSPCHSHLEPPSSQSPSLANSPKASSLLLQPTISVAPSVFLRSQPRRSPSLPTVQRLSGGCGTAPSGSSIAARVRVEVSRVEMGREGRLDRWRHIERGRRFAR